LDSVPNPEGSASNDKHDRHSWNDPHRIRCEIYAERFGSYEKQNELLQSIVGDAAVYLRREAVLPQRWINCLAKKAIIAGRPSQRGAQNSG
jgi:hypothetical protein